MARPRDPNAPRRLFAAIDVSVAPTERKTMTPTFPRIDEFDTVYPYVLVRGSWDSQTTKSPVWSLWEEVDPKATEFLLVQAYAGHTPPSGNSLERHSFWWQFTRPVGPWYLDFFNANSLLTHLVSFTVDYTARFSSSNPDLR